jgi:hypothetical protein
MDSKMGNPLERLITCWIQLSSGCESAASTPQLPGAEKSVRTNATAPLTSLTDATV